MRVISLRMRANKPSSLFICSAWNKRADFTMPLMEIIPKLYFMEVLEMTNDYLKMLFEKEEDVRNRTK